MLAAGLAMPFLAGAAAAHGPTRWQFVSPYPDSNFHTRNLHTFVEEVRAASGGRLAITLHSNGSLLPMPQIKRGVQTTQVQLGEILLSAYGDEDPFFELDGIPHLVTSYEQARRLMELSRGTIEARLQRRGMAVLFMVPWPGAGFYTNFPLDRVETLRGTRLRSFNAMSTRFAKLVGAMPALIQAADIPHAFAAGQVNVMVTSAATGVDSAAWEYARYFTPVGFSFAKNVVLVNIRALQALPIGIQAAIRTAAAHAEARGWALSAETGRETEAMLAQRGVTVAQPSQELLRGLAQVSATMVEDWVGRAGEDGRRLIAAYRERS